MCNHIAELLAMEEAKRKKPNYANRYVKPQSIKDFEQVVFEADCKKFQRIEPQLIARRKFEDKTANGLTNLICFWINFYGGNARRVNTGGIYNPKTKKFRFSGSTNGAADISATWHGKSLQIEIKAGKDRPRENQLRQQAMERAAGGIYEFVHNFDEFLQIIKTL